MELIRGDPFTKVCDESRLPLRARLELFVQVCHAIQHAHHKGVIHRDVKPTKVLVTLHDGVPVPRVIDFGIAKATSAELTQRTLFTEFRQMVGTPESMAPEQAEMSGLDVDTRADVDSLGVLLYELLTGSQPFDLQKALSKGDDEVMGTIREDDAPAPSTRARTTAEGTKVEQQRRVAPGRLSTLLRGDLDWIVLRALEKDRTRRYDTPSAFAHDILRDLADESVLTSPPSQVHRLRKWVRRHRGRVASALAIFVLLAGGVTATTLALFEAVEANEDLDAALKKVEHAHSEAVASAAEATASAQQAEHERERADEVKGIIAEMLLSVRPEFARTQDHSLLLGILDETAARIEAGELSDPLIEAELRALIGGSHRAMDYFDRAERHLDKARELFERELGSEAPETLQAMPDQAQLWSELGRKVEAETQLRDVLRLQELLPDSKEEDLDATRGTLGWLLAETQRFNDAEKLMRQVVDSVCDEFGEDSIVTAGAMQNLALLHSTQGDSRTAVRMSREILALQRRHLGDTSPETLKTMASLGSDLVDLGQLREAESLLSEAHETQCAITRPSHPQSLIYAENLAQLYATAGRFEDAVDLQREVVALSEGSLGEDSPRTSQAKGTLAGILTMSGDLEEALELNREILAEREESLAPADPELLGLLTNTGIACWQLGRLDESLERSVPLKLEHLGIESPSTRYSVDALIQVYREQGLHADALPLQRQMLDYQLEEAEREDAPPNLLNSAAFTLCTIDDDERRDPEKARELARRSVALTEAEGGGELFGQLHTLALAQSLCGEVEDAVTTEERCLSLLPEGHPARSEIAATIARYRAEAEK